MATLLDLIGRPLAQLFLGGVRRPGSGKNAPPLTLEEIEALSGVWQTYSPDLNSWTFGEHKGALLIETGRGSRAGSLHIRKDEITFHGHIHNDSIKAAVNEAKEAWGGKCEVFGPEDFKLRFWAAAQVAGVKITNYSPPQHLMGPATPFPPNAEYYLQQAQLDQQNRDRWPGAGYDDTRKQREREMARTGKDFWQLNGSDEERRVGLYNFDEFAMHIPRKSDPPEQWRDFWDGIPHKARAPLFHILESREKAEAHYNRFLGRESFTPEEAQQARVEFDDAISAAWNEARDMVREQRSGRKPNRPTPSEAAREEHGGKAPPSAKNDPDPPQDPEAPREPRGPKGPSHPPAGGSGGEAKKLNADKPIIDLDLPWVFGSVWDRRADLAVIAVDHVTYRLSTGDEFNVSRDRITLPKTLTHTWFRGVAEHAAAHWDGAFATGGGPTPVNADLRLMYRAYAQAFGVKHLDRDDQDFPLAAKDLQKVPQLVNLIRDIHNLPPLASTAEDPPPKGRGERVHERDIAVDQAMAAEERAKERRREEAEQKRKDDEEKEKLREEERQRFYQMYPNGMPGRPVIPETSQKPHSNIDAAALDADPLTILKAWEAKSRTLAETLAEREARLAEDDRVFEAERPQDHQRHRSRGYER